MEQKDIQTTGEQVEEKNADKVPSSAPEHEAMTDSLHEPEDALDAECEEEIPEDRGLVSIIVPVYNVEKYLQKCLDTILRQSYPYFELILIDDGSTDSSPRICDEFAEQDSRVRVIHKQNEGVSRARNLGIETATGDFIVFVDSDDGIAKHMLKKMVAAMTRYQTDLAISGFERFRENWKQRSRLSPYSLVIFQSQLELASVYKKPNTNMFGISIWAKMYRADIIREHNIRFQEDVHYEEDCLFNLDYFRHVTTTAVLRDYFYFYRQMDVSLSKGYRKNSYGFLVRGYNGRKAYYEELGLNSAGLDAILMIVIKNTFVKIFDSDLPLEEKMKEYQSVMDFQESQVVCQTAVRSRSRLTRMIAKACTEKNSKKIHSILRLWRLVDQAKAFIKKVLRKLKLRR